jgi:hypothetical protein
MDAQQKAVMSQIADVVSRWTGGQGDPRPLISIAVRESALRPRAAGDFEVARESWEKKRPEYEAAGNPHVGETAMWEASRGLYGLMAPYNVWRWSWTASPAVLHDVEISTVIAARLLNRARKMGAKTVLDARMLWAYGPDGLDISHDDPRYTSRLELERKRMQKLGYPESLATAPIAGLRLDAFGTMEQPDQNAKLADRQGSDTVSPTRPVAGGVGLALVLAVLAWRLFRA